MGTKPKDDPVKHCAVCGKRMTRKRFNGRLEDRTRFLLRRTCSQSCGNTKIEVTKSAHHWRARKYVANECADCGTGQNLHVHHIDRNPSNDNPSNLMTLCASCHLKRHWAEDRSKRLAAAVKAKATAAQRGANTRPRSTDGRFSSVA